MTNNGDAAEQVVKLSLEGFEVAAKLTGSMARDVAVLLASVLKQQITQSEKTRGKARLTSMIKSGKELKVFSIPQKDLKKFTQHAKHYGVLYCVLRDKNINSPDVPIDIIARAEDASKIQRIVERFQLGKVDKVSIVSEAERTVSRQETMDKPRQKEKSAQKNPTAAKTEKSPLSAPDFAGTGMHTDKGAAKTPEKKPSVREKLERYKAQAAKQKEAEHIVPETAKGKVMGQKKPAQLAAERKTKER